MERSEPAQEHSRSGQAWAWTQVPLAGRHTCLRAMLVGGGLHKPAHLNPHARPPQPTRPASSTHSPGLLKPHTWPPQAAAGCVSPPARHPSLAAISGEEDASLWYLSSLPNAGMRDVKLELWRSSLWGLTSPLLEGGAWVGRSHTAEDKHALHRGPSALSPSLCGSPAL